MLVVKKVKRSRLSLEEIKEAKREERRKKKAQKELEEKRREVQSAQMAVEEVSEVTEETGDVLGLLLPNEEPDEEIVDGLSLDKIRETLLAEESVEEDSSTDLRSVLPGVTPAPITPESAPS